MVDFAQAAQAGGGEIARKSPVAAVQAGKSRMVVEDIVERAMLIKDGVQKIEGDGARHDGGKRPA